MGPKGAQLKMEARYLRRQLHHLNEQYQIQVTKYEHILIAVKACREMFLLEGNEKAAAKLESTLRKIGEIK